MDTSKRLHENISALADGELPDSERELALAALASDDGRAAWRAYHVIGDALRAGADGALSDGFADRLAQRLAAEPPLAVPPAGAPAAASEGDGDAPAVLASAS
ncbi:MAG: sigma-E factor negative regulatory protein [Pseudomonadota bacterium]